MNTPGTEHKFLPGRAYCQCAPHTNVLAFIRGLGHESETRRESRLYFLGRLILSRDSQGAVFLETRLHVVVSFPPKLQPFVRQRIRRIELLTNFYDQMLSLEVLHERIDRFTRDAQLIHNVSDPQCARIQNGLKHFANPV